MKTSKKLINIKNIPSKPGVYFFENFAKEIIYVGKAKNLKNRLSSYRDPKLNPRIKEMVKAAETVSWVICPSEKHALILESQYIKREQPKYNIKLKNSQPYPFISFVNEEGQQPGRVEVSWREAPKAYGPYPGLKADAIVDALTNIYPVRSCKPNIYNKHHKINKPCELGDLGKCPAPCVSSTGGEQNSENILKIKKFLKGIDQNEVLDDLEKKMITYSNEEKFEKATIIRDSLTTLTKLKETSRKTEIKRNALFLTVLAAKDDNYGFAILKIRENSVVSVYRDVFKSNSISNSEILQQIVSLVHAEHGGEHFDNSVIIDFIPKVTPEEYSEVKNNLKNFEILIVKAGSKSNDLKKLGRVNAEHALTSNKDELNRKIHSLQILKSELNLKRNPYRIEGYDISHINGKYPYGSVVVFENARQVKYESRVVKIPDDLAQNDLQSLSYVLGKRLTPNFIGYETLPDLLVIDGGKEQFKIAYNIIKNLNLNIKVVSLAKKMEELYVDTSNNPLILSRSGNGLKLLQAVRDASHNLALDKHRSKRDTII
jgi:excinuclease ABC subunit C